MDAGWTLIGLDVVFCTCASLFALLTRASERKSVGDLYVYRDLVDPLFKDRAVAS